MPRIVMVNTVCSGSHGRIMRDLRDKARQSGFFVTLAAARGQLTEDVVQIGSRADVLAHVARTRLLDGHARGSLRATRRLIARLEAIRPDLVHLHNVHGYYLHAETLFDYLRKSGTPTLWTHHDCWAFTGHCSHYARAACDRWQRGCHACPLKREYPASYGLDASRGNWRWKRAAFASVPGLEIIAPSEWLSAQLGASFLRDIPRAVIPNGVDLTLFSPHPDGEAVRAQYGVRPDQKLLLAVASPFDARKGYADALAVAALLGDAARLVLVGLTEKQITALPEGIIGLRRTDGPEALVSLYSAADCLINPTYEDTYPTVNMEAMACGTPVACYGVGGAAEQLEPPCGMAVPVGDVQGLAGAAMALAGQRTALRTPCRAYAQAHFDRRAAMDAYLKRYQAMTGA